MEQKFEWTERSRPLNHSIRAANAQGWRVIQVVIDGNREGMLMERSRSVSEDISG